MVRWFCILLVALPVRAFASPELEEVPRLERERVARLADEGLALFESGDFDAALKRFEEAEGRVPVPTLTLHRGLTLEKLGRLVEAKRAFEIASTTQLEPNAPWQHSNAQRTAQRELLRLSPLVPMVRIALRGGEGARQVFLDGRPIGVTGDLIPVDPGTHSIKGRDPEGAVAEAVVDVIPGSRTEVVLEFSHPHGDPTARTVWTALGYGLIGLSGAALGVAIGTGVASFALAADIETGCGASNCSSSTADDEQLQVYRVVAVSSLIAGAVSSGLGVAAVVVGGGEKSSAKLTLGPASFALSIPLP
jgi:hypothetical protein